MYTLLLYIWYITPRSSFTHHLLDRLIAICLLARGTLLAATVTVATTTDTKADTDNNNDDNKDNRNHKKITPKNPNHKNPSPNNQSPWKRRIKGIQGDFSGKPET